MVPYGGAARHEVRVYRPSTAAYRSFVKPGLVVGGVLLVAYAATAVAFGPLRAYFPLGLMLTVAVLALGYALLYLRRAQVSVGPDAVVMRGVVRTRSAARRDLGPAVLVDLVQGRTGGYRLILLRADGRRLIKLPAGFWTRDQLDEIAEVAGTHVDRLGCVTPRQLRAEHPGAVGWLTAHPIKAGLLGALIVFALVLGGTAIFVALDPDYVF